MKQLTSLLMVVLFLFLFYVFVSPYWVAYQIQQAVQHNDAKHLAQYIDFPMLQNNLKQRIHLRVLEVQDAHPEDPLHILSRVFATRLINKVVDFTLTPEGIALLLQGKELKESISFSQPLDSASTDHPIEQTPSVKLDYSGHYESFNQFEVTLLTEQAQEIQFILHRDGLSWKLVDIKLPF